MKRLDRSRPVPEAIAETTGAFVRFEREASRAVVGRDPAGIEYALALHPWTHESASRRAMARDITRPLATPER